MHVLKYVYTCICICAVYKCLYLKTISTYDIISFDIIYLHTHTIRVCPHIAQISVFVHSYMCIFRYVDIYICVYLYMCIFMCVYLCVYIYVCIFMCVYLCMYICICTHRLKMEVH